MRQHCQQQSKITEYQWVTEYISNILHVLLKDLIYLFKLINRSYYIPIFPLGIFEILE